MADDPIEVVSLVGNDVREIVAVQRVDQESDHDQGEGVVHGTTGDLQEKQHRHDAEDHVVALRKSGAADELVHVDEAVGDGGHPQDGQEQVHPQRPAAGLGTDGVDDEGQGVDEGHVDHAEGVSLDRPDRPVDGPADESDIQRTYRQGGLTLKFPHPRLRRRLAAPDLEENSYRSTPSASRSDSKGSQKDYGYLDQSPL